MKLIREEHVKTFLLTLGVVFLILFALAPFVCMVWISFTTDYESIYSGKEAVYNLNNYAKVFSDPTLNFMEYFKNSLVVSLITSVIVSLVASLAGYAVSRLKFPGRIGIPLLILALSMFPQISIVGYLVRIFSSLGWTNSYIALILPYIAWTVPIALWINLSYFGQIPVDLDRAALVDGASRFKTLYKIILPIALPGIFSGFLLVFIACFNEFLFALMLNTVRSQTLPYAINLFIGTMGQTDRGGMMAASAIASIPLIVLTLIFQRYIVQGLMGGAVKG